jgi:FkbM family methyltransferase
MDVVMREAIYNTAWGLSIRARNQIKRLGILGPLEPIALKLVPLLIRPPSTDVEIALPGGLRMIVPAGYPAARSIVAGLYEQDVTRLFNGLVREGMGVADLGANLGYYTLLASRIVGESGYVYAFEPDPTAYAYLKGNIELNGCCNVLAVRQAISDTNGMMNFMRDPQGAEGFLTREVRVERSIAVETISLDSFFAGQGWPAINAIKMDVEGSERAALIGMSELRRRNPELKLIMEFNRGALQRAGVPPGSLATILVELGFHHGQIIEQGLKSFSVTHAFPRSRATHNLLLQRDAQ